MSDEFCSKVVSILNTRRAQVFAWIGAAVLFGVGGWSIVHDIMGGGDWPAGTDIAVYQTGARAVLAGQSPYQFAHVQDPFAYPPFFAEIFALVALAVGYGKGWLLWSAATLACLFGATALMLRGFGVRTPWAYVALICGYLCNSHIVQSETHHGQINFLMAFLVVGGLALWMRGRVLLSALTWAIAIVSKPFIGVLVFYLLRKGDYKAAGATFGLSGVIFGASFLIFPHPIAVLGEWRTSSHWYTSLPKVALPDNQSFYGFFMRLFAASKYSVPLVDMPILAIVCTIPLILVAGALFLKTVPRGVPDGRDGGPLGTRTLVELGSALVLLMTLSPVLEGDHVFIFLPALVGAILVCWRQRWDRGWMASSALWLLAFANLFLPFALYQFQPYRWPQLHGIAQLRGLHYGLSFFLAASLSGLLLARLRSGDGATLRHHLPAGRPAASPSQP